MRVLSPSRWIPLALFTLAACSQDQSPETVVGPSASIGIDPSTGASVETNKDDYMPGEIVHLVMKGWAANEDVRLYMTENPDTHGDVDTTVTMDGNGEWNGHFYDVQEHDWGVVFTLTATGALSQSVAVATFTDGNVSLKSNALGVTYDVTVIPYGGGGAAANTVCGGSAGASSTTTVGFSPAASGGSVTANTSRKYVAPPTSNEGASFVSWTADNNSGVIYTAGSTDICVGGNVGPTLTANYDASPDLTVSKSTSSTFAVGNNVTYSIILNNIGTASADEGATPITVTDPVPTGLNFVSFTEGSDFTSCEFALGNVTCDLKATKEIAPGASSAALTITFTVTAAACTGGVTNTATASGGNEPIANIGNNTGSAPTAAGDIGNCAPPATPDLSVSKTDNAASFYYPVTGGENGTYELLVTNNGNAATSGTVTVVDVLVAELDYVSYSGTNWSCTESPTRTITCTTTQVIAGSGGTSSTLTLTVKPNQLKNGLSGNTIDNKASVSGGGDNTSADSNTETTPILGRPKLDVTKVATNQNTSNADPDPDFYYGATSVYTITVTNTGNAAATNTISVRDDLPTANLTFVGVKGGADNPDSWSCTNDSPIAGDVTCTSETDIGITAGSNTSTFKIEVTPTAVANDVDNAVSVAHGGDPDPPGACTEDPAYCETVDIIKAVTKTTLVQDSPTTEYGEDVKFTATVEIDGGLGGGTPAGSVAFKKGASCAAGTAITGSPVSLDGSGVAELTVDDLEIGTHTIWACYAGNANYEPSFDDVEHEVTIIDTDLTATVVPSSQQYSDEVELRAEVTPYESANQVQQLTGTVYFYVNGSVSCGTSAPSGSVGNDAIADADNGKASYIYAIDKPAGAYTVTACFYSSSSFFDNSSGTASLTVTAENATPEADGNNAGAFKFSTPITLKFSVKETSPDVGDANIDGTVGDEDLTEPGAIARLSLSIVANGINSGSPINNFTCASDGVTGSGYSAAHNFTCTSPGWPTVDAYEVVATVGSFTNATPPPASGSYYVGTGTVDAFAITDPSLGFVTGGGKFLYEGERYSFGLSYTFTGKNKSTARGNIVVIHHLPGGGICRAKSNGVEGPAITLPNKANITGKANYSCVSASGVVSNSQGNLVLLGYLEDNGEPGASSTTTPDQIWIRVTTLSPVVSQINIPVAVPLTGGNIQVPQPQKK